MLLPVMTIALPCYTVCAITESRDQSRENNITRRVATVRENIWKIIFFQVREKSGNFMDGQGNLEKTWKVREKTGNLKINGCLWQADFRFIYSVQEGKDVLSHEIV